MIQPQTSNTAQGSPAACDDENKGATVVNGIDSSGSNNNSNTSSLSSRPTLSITTTTSFCLCGGSLCGYDCHFLQQQFKDFEAVARQQRQCPRHGSSNNNGDAQPDGGTSGASDEDDDEAVADLERRFRRHFAKSAAASTAFDDTCLDDIIATPSDADVFPPARMSMRRTKSCGVHSSEFDQEQLQTRHNAYRLRIGYRDEALRERCEQNTQALLQRAVSDSSDAMSITTILARKALRYRKILERMEGVDVTDPELDVSKCLGVRWQRVSPPE